MASTRDQKRVGVQVKARMAKQGSSRQRGAPNLPNGKNVNAQRRQREYEPDFDETHARNGRITHTATGWHLVQCRLRT